MQAMRVDRLVLKLQPECFIRDEIVENPLFGETWIPDSISKRILFQHPQFVTHVCFLSHPAPCRLW